MTSRDDAFLRELVQSLGVAVAVVDPESRAIVFENERFFEWFPPGADLEDTAAARVPGLDLDQTLARVERRGTAPFEAEAGTGARQLSLAGTVSRAELGGEQYLVLEVRDTTKQREAEYLLDSYSKMVERHTRDLEREKERAERLLLNVMPRAVFEELKDSGFTTPERFDEATILMLDFVGFTEMAVSRDPTALIAELNDVFTVFDRIVEHFGCERLKTIGDAYMAVGGLPVPSVDHAVNVAGAALRMRRFIDKRNVSHREPWLCRIGIHSGPVIGSIVGVQKYVYDVFGPGVNLASRMEELATPMQILISAATYELVSGAFSCTDLGEYGVKGFGTQRVYSLDSEL